MSDNDTRVADLVDTFLDLKRTGRAPDPESFARRHPDVAPRLREALQGLAAVEEAAEQVRGTPGDTIGDYRIAREIGRGGMGVVYEAEDTKLKRRVALKVLPAAALLDPRQLQRFRHEAQAAAQLHHGNIVPVYGVGSHGGVHYYAMQYIDGVDLGTVLRDLREGAVPSPSPTPLSSQSVRTRQYLAAVCRLGIQAAEALDHAHQVGVVHRDVKPANLIVDASGHLWVTDFGLAQFERGSVVTRTGDLVGTFRYMSPEQALGKRAPIDHRTDVYSLGATLYELATLEPAVDGDEPQQVLQAISATEPVSPRKRNGAVPLELETILLKALAKEPAERYETAQALADDLRRLLDDRPIEARPPTVAQRARKWGRRHRGLVGAGACLLLLAVAVLSAGIVVIAKEKRRTSEALGQAERTLTFAHAAVDKFLVDAGLAEGLMRDVPIEVGARKDMLQDALRFYESDLTADRLDDAALRNKIAILSRLDRLEEALAAADRRIELAPGLGRARLARGIVLQKLGRLDEALVSVDHAIAMEPGYANAHAVRGEALRGLGRLEEALAAFDRAVALEPASCGAHNRRGMALADLGRHEDALAAFDRAAECDPGAGVDGNRGNALLRLGRVTDALVAYDRAIALDPANSSAHAGRGSALRALGRAEESLAACDRAIERGHNAHNNRGNALEDLGRREEALAAFDRAIALNPRNAAAHVGRGRVLDSFGRHDEALAAYERAIGIDPGFAIAYNNRGKTLHDNLHRPADALLDFDRAIELDPKLAMAHFNRGNALQSLGRFAGALAAYDHAIELDPRHAPAHNNRGGALRSLGRYEEALRAHDRAIELDPVDAKAHDNRGNALADLRRHEEALQAYDRAIKLDPGRAPTHSNRGELLQCLGRLEDALAACDRAIELDPGYARAHGSRGNALAGLRRHEEALEAYDRANELDPRSALADINRANVLCALGRHEEALAASDRAIERDPTLAFAQGRRGDVLRLLGRHQEALAAYDRSVTLDPRNALTHVARGWALENLGRTGEALDAFSRAVELDPGYANAHLDRGHALLSLGRPKEALAAFECALKIDPRLAAAHNNRGAALSKLGRHEEALVAHERAIELDPSDGALRWDLGSVLRSLGRMEAALAAFEKAISLGVRDPQFINEVAWTHAACVDPAHRNPDRAVELARTATGLAPAKGLYWQTLGLALFRAGKSIESLDALEKSMDLRQGGNAYDWFFVAMAKRKLGHADAREWYEEAVAWTERNKPDDPELKRFRAEAQELFAADAR